jgi:lipopolysaccharide/colanic/teichoic acid biosynthesis glycosyltransferase
MKEIFETTHAPQNKKPSVWSVLRELDPGKFLTLLVLVLYMPALAAVALMVVLTSAGPAFVNRNYLRPNGETVKLWEFRTVCWEKSKPTWVGEAIQQTSIVRMPALVNVLMGHIKAGERVKAV